MTQDYDELAKELLSLNLNMLHVPAKRKIGKMAQGEVFVLNYLATHQQSAHPGELSKSMVVSSARIAALLGRMEEKQLIRRIVSEKDARLKKMELLPKGYELHEVCVVIREEIENKLTQTLSSEEVEIFRFLCRRMIANMER